MVSKRFTESRIKTRGDLKRFLETMDKDEGVRINAEVKGFKDGGLIFITPSAEGFYINIAESGKTRQGKAKEKWKFANNAAEVMKFVEANRSKPLESWSY